MLFDDRPEIGLTLSLSEALTLKDALVLAAMVCEGQWEFVSSYQAAHGHAHEVQTLDRLTAVLHETMSPKLRQRSNDIKALVEEHRERFEEEWGDLSS